MHFSPRVVCDRMRVFAGVSSVHPAQPKLLAVADEAGEAEEHTAEWRYQYVGQLEINPEGHYSGFTKHLPSQQAKTCCRLLINLMSERNISLIRRENRTERVIKKGRFKWNYFVI